MSEPLLPAPVRRPAVALLIACLGTTAVLAARYRGQTQPGRWDAAVGRYITATLGGHLTFQEILILGHPIVVAAAAAAICLGCLSQRRWRAALLAATAVPAAGITTELVLKPLVHRTFGGGLTFPSGHGTGAFAVAAVIAVLLVDPPRPRLGRAGRAVLAAAALAAAGVVSVAVVAADNHYPTDMVGAAAVAVAVVLAAALTLDRLSPSGIKPTRFNG